MMQLFVWRLAPQARPLIIACVVLLLQTLALVALTAVGVWTALTMDTAGQGLRSDRALVVGLSVAALGGAFLLAALGRAIALGHGWARGPVITLEVLVALAGASSFGSSSVWLALALLLPAVVVVVVLLLPGVVAATTDEGRMKGAYPPQE